MNQSKQFYLETFGCQMNVVDSERIVDALQQLGYNQVETAEAADLILLNTCSIRDKAERRVYGHLSRYKPLKQKRPNLILGVGGCVAQQEGERLLRKLPYLDLVFGTHNVHLLPELVRQAEERRGRRAETAFLDEASRLRLFPRRTPGKGVTRFVTVMQGCDNFCSYCIVPHVRGREISRPLPEIVAEVQELAEQGVREITLIGQNVNSYGAKGEQQTGFAELLHAVHEVQGIERLRFMTSHPRDFSDELLACFGQLDKLCHHLHLPLQSGSDQVLREMNRGYTAASYLEKVARLREVCPEIRLTTDIIVGFPGETEADFLATRDLVMQVGYADIYLFLYSPRPGTAAEQWPDTTPVDEKQRRFDAILVEQTAIARRIWAQDVGQQLPILVEGPSRRGGEEFLFGRTTWNRIVNFRGGQELIGQVVPVRITRSNTNSQSGELA